MLLVCVDYETATVDEAGNPTASTEAYRHDFRVMSSAFAWDEDGQRRSVFAIGEEATEACLKAFIDRGAVFLVHNAQFEIMVTRCRFPDLAPRFTVHADTMRLVQYVDNAADEFAIDFLPTGDFELDSLTAGEVEKKQKKTFIGGLRLDNAVRRLLGDAGSHKEEAHSWLRDNAGIRKGQEGANLHLLPHDVLKRYNIADVVNTFRLYDHCVAKFREEGFNWQFNHDRLYLPMVSRVVGRKIKGVPVNVKQGKTNAEKVRQEVEEIGTAFAEKFKTEIAAVERARLLNRIRKLKSLRGRKQFLRRLKVGSASAVKDVRFNAGSNKQLASLFVDHLGIECRFRTDKGQPSFRSALLDQWGDGGLMLQTRRKRQLVMNQILSLVQLCEYDGRWHYDFRVAGTSTGRGAGGGG